MRRPPDGRLPPPSKRCKRLHARARSSAVREVGRQRRADVDSAPVIGCVNASRAAWRNCRSRPSSAGSPVHRVAGDRQVDRGEMHADLMRAPGLEGDAQQRMAWQQLFDLEMRDRIARRVGVERVPQRVVPVAPDRRLDQCRAATAGGRRRARGTRASPRAPAPAPAAAGAPPASARRRAARTCRGRAGARCRAAPARRRPRRRTRAARARACRCACPGAGMHDEPRRLVDDEQVLVLVRDDEIHRLRLERRSSAPSAARTRAPPRPRACSSSRAARPSTSTPPPLEQPLGDGARADLRQLGEEAVEPLARRGLRRDAQPRHVRAASGAARARRA